MHPEQIRYRRMAADGTQLAELFEEEGLRRLTAQYPGNVESTLSALALRELARSGRRLPIQGVHTERTITGAAALPIVHTIVPPLRNFPSSNPTPSGVAEVTLALRRIVTPACSIFFRAKSRRLELISGKIWSRE